MKAVVIHAAKDLHIEDQKVTPVPARFWPAWHAAFAMANDRTQAMKVQIRLDG